MVLLCGLLSNCGMLRSNNINIPFFMVNMAVVILCLPIDTVVIVSKATHHQLDILLNINYTFSFLFMNTNCVLNCNVTVDQFMCIFIVQIHRYLYTTSIHNIYTQHLYTTSIHNIYTHTCIYIHVYTNMYTHTCIHNIYTQTCIHKHAYTYMYTHTCIHIHVYTYMYTHTCIHIHVYTYTYVSKYLLVSDGKSIERYANKNVLLL